MEENNTDVIIEDEIVENNTDVIIEDENVQNIDTDVTNEFTDLLEQYIREQLEEKQNEEIEETDIENTDTIVLPDGEEDLQNISNDILSQILETELETKGEIVNQSLMMLDQESNNALTSNIETISLDNFLTLVLIASILFTSVLTFARRLF